MSVANSSSNGEKGSRSKARPALAERVYHLLYARISNGDYPTNSRLPPEVSLSEDFGVSRPVLRTALERLRSEGLIYSRQGAGSYVRAPQGQALGFAKVETIADIQRCYEFRINLETEAAGLSSERRTDENLKAMEEALRLMDAATLSHQHREDADFAFHLAVMAGARNHYFEASMRALREHIAVGMRMHGKSLMSDGPAGLQDVYEEHSAIFDAIKTQNAEAARRLMREHLAHSRERLFGGLLLDLGR
jgi:GntR family transcriptional regulator, transcriptional repressor for pyruvate dehydrogenase complex